MYYLYLIQYSEMSQYFLRGERLSRNIIVQFVIGSLGVETVKTVLKLQN